jgi:hypothetical protein
MTSSEQSSSTGNDLGTPITDAFVKAFASETLVLDCPSMTLRQHTEANPRVIHGRGMISLPQGEGFQLRMYVDNDDAASAHPLAALMKMMKWVPGEIIPREEYFSLEAIDLSGFAWACKTVQIDSHGAGYGTVITGKLYDVLAHRVSGLFNQSVMTHVTSSEGTLSQSLLPKFAKFDADDFRFEVQRLELAEGSTILRVFPKGGLFPAGIETRVEESLRYVTFSPIRWCIVDKQQQGAREVIVVPQSNHRKGLFDEPLDHRHPDYAIDYWRLFVAYFQHVVGFNEAANYHPLSAQLFHVISSETQQLDLTGLLISVAVEGVLNVEFEDVARPSDAFRATLDRVATVIRRLKCVDEGLAKRLLGVLPPMKSSRPKDKFIVLEASGVITNEMVKEWEKLRNAIAHAAVRFDPTKTQTIWNRCNIVYTMLNLLVFRAIGYSGRYQDFSSRGWPIKKVETPKQ